MLAIAERISELNAFMDFVRQRWPLLRHSHGGEISTRCRRCINSERYSALSDGLCAECRRPAAMSNGKSNAGSPRQFEACDALLKSSAGTGKTYDALLLFSGGKDSAFLLRRLQRDYPSLRMLAIMVNNGFASPIAFHNITRVFSQIAVDHVVITPQHTLYEHTFRLALKQPLLSDGYSTVDFMDGDLTFDICRNTAARLEIPLMIAGLSPEQIERILKLDSFESPPELERLRRKRSGGVDLDSAYPGPLRSFWWDGSIWDPSRISRVIFPFYAWGYNEALVRQEVLDCGLIEPGQDNPLLTNNHLIPLIIYRDIKKLGYSTFEPEFAALVRNQKADRDFWLSLFEACEYLTRHEEFLTRCISETLERLELTWADIGGMLRQ